MEKSTIHTTAAPAAIGPYSQGTVGAGIVTVAGQIPIDPETNQMAKGIVAQTARAMENVLAILKASGSSSEKILKCCLYIRNMQDFDLINEAYASFFPGDPPARVVVEVSKLPKNADIEIDALAII